jgi:protein-S-isoprenylcysteine O-methyltransferase Ste14
MQMELPRGVVLGAGYATWLAFAFCTRFYFRGARRVQTAKTWLTRAALACTLAQLVVLTVTRPFLLGGEWVALAVYAAAHALYWGALAVHGRERPAFAFLPVAPPRLKTTGSYRLVRHPIYTAYLLGWLAGPLATGQWWLLLPTGAMAALYYWAARVEERLILAGPLAAEYQDYRERTGMFIPRLVA